MCVVRTLTDICAVQLCAPQLSVFESYPTQQCWDTAQGVPQTRAAPNTQLMRHPYSEEFDYGHALPLPLMDRQ